MEKITIDLFEKFKYISEMKANPSQSKLAFLSAKADLEKNNYGYDLYKIENYKMSKIVHLKTNGQFIWEDDDTVLFPYTKNKTEEKQKKDMHAIYYRYHIENKGFEKAYEFPIPVKIEKVLGSKLILRTQITKEDEILFSADEKERKNYLKTRKEKYLYEDIDKVPFYFNGRGFINDARSLIYLYDINENTFTLVNNEKVNAGQMILSKDEKTIYYVGQPQSKLRLLYDYVYQYDIETKQTTFLYHKSEYGISWIQLLNDELVCAANNHEAYGLNQNDDFYKIIDGELVLFASFGKTIGNTTGSDARLGGQPQVMADKDRIIFISTVDDHTVLETLNKDGSLEIMYEAYGALEGLTMVEDKVYFVASLKQRLQEIYAFNHGREQQLTRLNYRALKDYYISRPKKYVLKKENHEVTGFTLVPEDYSKDKKYPMILDIHGGPKTIYSTNYYHEMQYWANQGYVVAFCNPRGSDGKGNDFADIRGKYGTIDYDDIMGFVDYVLKRNPQIDKKQLYVTGGSYGGFMTNWIVGHTDRFRAAASQRSISNWVSFFGTSDIGFYFAKDQTAATPIKDIDLMWEQSPLKYVDQVKTPILFIHSDQDYRCPIEQAMQFYSVLQYKEIDTKLVWFKGETHELSRGGKPQARMKRLKEITKWFETH